MIGSSMLASLITPDPKSIIARSLRKKSVPMTIPACNTGITRSVIGIDLDRPEHVRKLMLVVTCALDMTVATPCTVTAVVGCATRLGYCMAR